jgi:hypothetical protein
MSDLPLTDDQLRQAEPVEHQIFATEAEELAALRAEIRRLRLRLAAAEQVATLCGWLGVDHSETGKAATQAWMDWSHEYGSPSPSPEWRERIRVLAMRRDEIRSATLARLAGAKP